jgi:hypothetical protein
VGVGQGIAGPVQFVQRVPIVLPQLLRDFQVQQLKMQVLSAQFCERTLRNLVLARSIFISIFLSSISSIFTLVYTYIYIFDSVYSGGGRCLRLSGVLLCVASKHRGSVAAESLWPVARWL